VPTTLKPQPNRVVGISMKLYIDSFPLFIEMPCGRILTIVTAEDFPWGKTVPCTCGDPSHFFVVHQIIEKEE